MSVQTTHIGSLPFTDINTALDYTFQFDLPVLFTLPSFGAEHFMGADLCYQLGILNSVKVNGGLEISENKKFKSINPFFFREFVKAKGNKEFKYQIIGPYTLSKMIINSGPSLKKISEELIPPIKALIQSLEEEGLILLSFDEPLLFQANEEELQIVKEFIKELKKEKVNFSVHVCSDIPLASCLKLEAPLNLDISTLKIGFESYLPFMNIIGLSKGTLNLQGFMGTNLLKYLGNVYISPSCGLYGRTPEFCHSILSNLRESKENYIAAKI